MTASDDKRLMGVKTLKTTLNRVAKPGFYFTGGSVDSNYMIFQAMPTDRKTKVIDVTNKKGGYLLGIIQWQASWRQYCFFPAESMVFSKGCLEDISAVIAELMEARKG